MKLDKWQEEILATKGNICLRSGRQVGKSTIISYKAGDFAANNSKKTILVIASVERQAYHLFDMIHRYLYENYKSYIKKGKDRPTKSKIKLRNGSQIYCLPTGLSGTGIRGYTIDLLIVDEAAFIPEDVWTAVTPMLVTTGGDIWLLSTPHGKEGYYYSCFKDDNFSKFHISTETLLTLDTREEAQKDRIRDKLKREKESMSKLQYTQEYLGEFVDELMQFFPSDVIKQCLVRSVNSSYSMSNSLFLGVDIAHLGEDETVLCSVCLYPPEKLSLINMEITTKTRITETIRRVKILDKLHNYKKIYIDDGGIGVGVFDTLLEDEQTKRKVVAINNASRPLDRENKRKKILKEDLYNNLLRLMEKSQIELFDDPRIFQSLKSIQYEYTDSGNLRIYGKYTHIAEALIRAAWCVKDKSLNIYIY